MGSKVLPSGGLQKHERDQTEGTMAREHDTRSPSTGSPTSPHKPFLGPAHVIPTIDSPGTDDWPEPMRLATPSGTAASNSTTNVQPLQSQLSKNPLKARPRSSVKDGGTMKERAAKEGVPGRRKSIGKLLRSMTHGHGNGISSIGEELLTPRGRMNRLQSVAERAYARPTMREWTLTFHDVQVERAFRRHIKTITLPRIKLYLNITDCMRSTRSTYVVLTRVYLLQLGVVLTMVYTVAFSVLEYVCDYSHGAKTQVMGLRIAMLALMSVFQLAARSRFVVRRIHGACLGLYAALGQLYILVDAAGTAYGSTQASGVPVYGFFKGRWSLLSTLLFITIVFQTSGLRLQGCIVVVTSHFVSMVVVLLAAFWHDRASLAGWEIAVVPMLNCINALSAHILERHMREDFVLRCEIAQTCRKRENVLNSMLPPRVSRMLQDGRKAVDVAEYYTNVTILFGYITGFKELTTGANQDELVSFVNAIFTSFDHGTDHHNVYKLEAIEASYLCCAGVPDPEEKGGAHADRVVEMAVTMLAIAYNSKLPSTAAGDSEVDRVARPEMKIGVHTGPVVAGVAGMKAPSYHCFGDTINTASRMGSTGAKNRIQLSASAYNSLTQAYQERCTARGSVQVKGKGIMNTYWLDCDEDELNARYAEFRQFRYAAMQYDPDLKNAGLDLLNNQQDKKEDEFVASTVENVRRDYNTLHNSSRRPHVQRVLLLVLVATCASMYAEFFGEGDDLSVTAKKVWMGLRFGAFVMAAVVLAASTMESLVQHMQQLTAVACAAYVALVNTDLLFVPVHYLAAVNMIIIVTMSLLVNLRFVLVLLLNTGTVVLYTLFIVAGDSHDLQVVEGCLLFVFTTAVVGGWACYKRDQEFRYDYLHQLILKENKSLLADEPVMDHLSDVTIMFSDLKGYTEWCSKHEPMEVYRMLNKVYTAFDKHIEPSGVYKLDTIGDAFVVVAGLDGYKSQEDHAMAMVMFAFRMLFELERIKASDGLQFEMRIGIHTGISDFHNCGSTLSKCTSVIGTGPAIGSVIGMKKPRYLMWGKTPLVANELEASGTPGKVLVSSSTFKRLAKAKLAQRGLSYRPSSTISLCSGTETISTYLIEMESVTAVAQLAREIQTEQGPDANESRASSPGGRSTALMTSSALSKIRSVLLMRSASSFASRSVSPAPTPPASPKHELPSPGETGERAHDDSQSKGPGRDFLSYDSSDDDDDSFHADSSRKGPAVVVSPPESQRHRSFLNIARKSLAIARGTSFRDHGSQPVSPSAIQEHQEDGSGAAARRLLQSAPQSPSESPREPQLHINVVAGPMLAAPSGQPTRGHAHAGAGSQRQRVLASAPSVKYSAAASDDTIVTEDIDAYDHIE
ncbi:adenylate and guanylate cyclase catalytic domain-containing protein [Tribonema minus]|uniref:Adenylate and guanylate cyclase catalytic domain-containing protein n=1 Tax=Tribonema minus TaxID=303371 RepID=A0A835Z2D8_9STRA|nr:adenylate and guanylate cyclase catalytic domain-containing protein [Tribonema minus]